MPRYFVGLTITKSGVVSQQLQGSSRFAVKTGTAVAVNDGTHYKGVLVSNLFPGVQVAAKNPAGT
jgi:hypothetical protein